ncbi:MAG: ATP-binding protein, partial [Candidatus Eremiobacterota bacterium]
MLDALAVALGIWHKVVPGSGWRNILPAEVRVTPVQAGDRLIFERQLPSVVEATSVGIHWVREIKKGGVRTTNRKARWAEQEIANRVKEAEAQRAMLPVLAYYGAGRAWLPTNRARRDWKVLMPNQPTRFDAYRGCLDARINEHALNEWFLLETAAG